MVTPDSAPPEEPEAIINTFPPPPPPKAFRLDPDLAAALEQTAHAPAQPHRPPRLCLSFPSP